VSHFPDYDHKYDISVSIYKKCKAIPLQAWTGPEGSRSLRLPDFKTIWEPQGGRCVGLTTLPPENIPGTHFC